MRRLEVQQCVTLDLDPPDGGKVECVDCRVQSVHGPVGVLAPVAIVAPVSRTRLKTGLLSFMTFQHQSAPVALRGVALASPQSADLEFVVIDGVQVAERRTAARVRLLTPIRATSVDAGGLAVATVATVTVNLSMGGAMLTRRPNFGPGPRWEIELALPHDSTPVRCDAVLVRDTPTHVAVRFENMEQTDQLRLAAVLADHQRRTRQRA